MPEDAIFAREINPSLGGRATLPKDIPTASEVSTQPRAGMMPASISASIEFDKGCTAKARYMTNDFTTGRRDKVEGQVEERSACSSCGKVLIGDSHFCHSCGKPCKKNEIAFRVPGLQEKAGVRDVALTPRQFTPAPTPNEANGPIDRLTSISDNDDDDSSSLLSVPLSKAKRAKPSLLPPDDIFFVQCSACTKFVQLSADDVNCLLQNTSNPLTCTLANGVEVPQVSNDDSVNIPCNRCFQDIELRGRAFNKLLVEKMVTNIGDDKDRSLRREKGARSSRSPISSKRGEQGARKSRSPERMRRANANAGSGSSNRQGIRPFDRDRSMDLDEDWMDLRTVEEDKSRDVSLRGSSAAPSVSPLRPSSPLRRASSTHSKDSVLRSSLASCFLSLCSLIVVFCAYQTCERHGRQALS